MRRFSQSGRSGYDNIADLDLPNYPVSMMAARNTFCTILCALVAAFGSAVIYLIVLQPNNLFKYPLSETMLWLAALSLMLLPITTFSSLAVRYSAQPAIMLRPFIIVAILVGPIGASTIGFVVCMSAFFPALNWNEVWWLPMIASVLAAGVRIHFSFREKQPH